MAKRRTQNCKWMPLLLFGGDCEEEFTWSIFFFTSDALDSLETLFLKVYSVDTWDQDYQFSFKKNVNIWALPQDHWIIIP